jgi:hypothetical protein
MANNGYPSPVSFLQSLAVIIARQRSSVFQLFENLTAGENLAAGLLQATTITTTGGRSIGSAGDRHIEEKMVRRHLAGCHILQFVDHSPNTTLHVPKLVMLTRKSASTGCSMCLIHRHGIEHEESRDF